MRYFSLQRKRTAASLNLSHVSAIDTNLKQLIWATINFFTTVLCLQKGLAYNSVAVQAAVGLLPSLYSVNRMPFVCHPLMMIRKWKLKRHLNELWQDMRAQIRVVQESMENNSQVLCGYRKALLRLRCLYIASNSLSNAFGFHLSVFFGQSCIVPCKSCYFASP